MICHAWKIIYKLFQTFEYGRRQRFSPNFVIKCRKCRHKIFNWNYALRNSEITQLRSMGRWRDTCQNETLIRPVQHRHGLGSRKYSPAHSAGFAVSCLVECVMLYTFDKYPNSKHDGLLVDVAVSHAGIQIHCRFYPKLCIMIFSSQFKRQYI